MNRAAERANLGRVALLALFLAPLSIAVGEDNVSANYLFALLLILAPDGYREDRLAFAYISFCVVAWMAGAAIFSSGDGGYLIRQGASAVIWVASAMLLFVRLRFTLNEIVVAAIAVAVAYSAFAVFQIVQHSTAIADVYFVKARMRNEITDWPQRYVVVLLFAFFVALERGRHGIIWTVWAMVILACIFLTFTRAAWLGLGVGLAAYCARTVWVAASARAHPTRHRRGFATTGLGLALIAGLVIYGATLDQVRAAFDNVYANASLVINVLLSDGEFAVGGSEQTRLALWDGIVDLVGISPLTGTGFAGPHLLMEGTGGAHSQYFDVLLRTGVVGLAFYLLFWTRLLRFYVRWHAGVFAGLIAIAVFGVFHETTKLSYGAFLFFALLNKATELRESASRERPNDAASAMSRLPAV